MGRVLGRGFGRTGCHFRTRGIHKQLPPGLRITTLVYDMYIQHTIAKQNTVVRYFLFCFCGII